MRKYLLPFIGACSLTSGAALAGDWVDITQDFTSKFDSAAVGTYGAVDWTEYESRCLAKNPINGQCITGERSRARGSIKLESLVEQSGVLKKRNEEDPITGEGGITDYASNLYFVFTYSGTTEAEHYTSNVLTDRPWGDLHPGGIVKVWLSGKGSKNGRNWVLRYKFEANPGNDDKPNWFIVNYAAPSIKTGLAEKVKVILGLDDLPPVE